MKKDLPISVVVIVILACVAVVGYLLYDRFKEPPKPEMPKQSKELDDLMEKSLKNREQMTPEDWKKLRDMRKPGAAATPGG